MQISPERSRRYFNVNTALHLLSQTQLIELLGQAESTQGWGVNQLVYIADEAVFVKRVPLTALEYEQAYATHNLLGLPMYYHYGVGSAGFGAFRELNVHIKANHWVLRGQALAFPLLYHARIIPSQAPWKTRSEESFERHIQDWNNNAAIAHYLKQREKAPYELVLCLEYFPHVLFESFQTLSDLQLRSIFQQAEQALSFMNAQGVLHLDGHLANLLLDEAGRVYISDFGLALDLDFDLDDAELAFWHAHRHYDRALLWNGWAYILRQRYEALDPILRQRIEQRLGMQEAEPFVKLQALLGALDNVPELRLSGELIALLQHYREPILRMSHFGRDLRDNPAKDTPWHDLAIETWQESVYRMSSEKGRVGGAGGG